MAERPRILFVTDHCAGPTAGYGIRVTNTVNGLRSVGQVTVVFLRRAVDDNRWPTELIGPDERVVTIDAEENFSRLGYLTSLASGRPRDAVYANRDDLAEALTPLVADHDLIWLFRARPFDAVRPALNRVAETAAGPAVVVDFDDLYDDYHRQRADGSAGWAIKALARLLARQWQHHQQQVAAAVDQVLVTNEQDRRRLRTEGLGHVDVLVNGYPDGPPAPTGEGHCRILFVGGHHYGPNAEAAELLACRVLPLVRRQVADAELLLVGRPGPITPRLAQQPGVDHVGFVDSVDAAFARASVVCTPIQRGTGSRLKVLEAMARRLPLVSTAFGCQGFDLVDGKHYLRAETADDLAAAIVRLHRSPATARDLTAAAYDHFRGRFDSASVERLTAEIATRQLAGRR